ncbi:MAG: acyltransferase [Bacteroidaceae bacterium]|nr:acyltransferase [Bacteroidaceae bacterium]
MSLIQNIKGNHFVRGLWRLWTSYFSACPSKFGYLGENVRITPPYTMHLENIFIYDNVGIGPNSFISTPNAKVVFKGHTAVAEGLTIHSGNHARIIGKYVSDITDADKPKGYDSNVTIEEDVWIGSNVTILSGVTIGRGCTIAAQAVCNRDIPPYCIAGGVPARVIKMYWSVQQILEHEQKLYPLEQRLSREYLEQIHQSLVR